MNGPIEAKFHVEPPRDGGTKLCSNSPDHITKMAAMPIYILKNFRNATFYVDCFLNWVDLMLFPIQYVILLRDKQ